jgi:hypothetical protein
MSAGSLGAAGKHSEIVYGSGFKAYLVREAVGHEDVVQHRVAVELVPRLRDLLHAVRAAANALSAMKALYAQSKHIALTMHSLCR